MSGRVGAVRCGVRESPCGAPLVPRVLLRRLVHSALGERPALLHRHCVWSGLVTSNNETTLCNSSHGSAAADGHHFGPTFSDASIAGIGREYRSD